MARCEELGSRYAASCAAIRGIRAEWIRCRRAKCFAERRKSRIDDRGVSTSRLSPGVSRTLIRDAADQTFQILTLGKVQSDRMIGAGAQVFDDLRVDAGIERGARDDFLE